MTLPLGLTLPAIADDENDSAAIVLPSDETTTAPEKTPAANPSGTSEPSEVTDSPSAVSPSGKPVQVVPEPTEAPSAPAQPSLRTPQPSEATPSDDEVFGDNTHAVWGNELGIDPEVTLNEKPAVQPASHAPSSVKNHNFFLNDRWTGNANIEFSWGEQSHKVLVGDWDGDGKDTVALRKGGQFAFSNASPASGTPKFTLAWGLATDTVLVGDWNGDGKDTLAIRRGNSYHIKNSLSGSSTDQLFYFGKAGDEVFVGDWDGDGTDTLAVRRGNEIHISNKNTTGKTDNVITYGRAGDDLYVGSFDRTRLGRDSFAVRRGNTYFINKAIKSGEADIKLDYGRVNDVTLLGDWNGDGEDTLGVVRSAATKAPAQPTPPPVAKTKGSDVLAFAKRYTGAPYSWGGVTPSGWDCIGMVRYVYKQYGVNIGGYTSDVLSAGRQVPFSQAQPGDILYWSSGNTLYGNAHVALYVNSSVNFGAWNESMGTREGNNSWVGGTPIVIRVFN